MIRLAQGLKRFRQNRIVKWGSFLLLVALIGWMVADILFFGGSLGSPRYNPGKARGY